MPHHLTTEYLDAISRPNVTPQFPGVVPPPPLVIPLPLSFPGGGGSLGQPKFFRCGSLCCCVGDCVVGHCHLHPLHSWQDILLTFAEMELDSESGEHVQEFKVKWSRTKKFYTEPVNE